MEKIQNRIITISGDPASGKGEVTKKLQELYLAEGCKVHIISVGDIQKKVIANKYREMFPEAVDVPIGEMSSDPEFADKLKEIDIEIDCEIKKLGEWINSEPREGEIYIIDSRLAWKMIPDSFSVRLSTDTETAGERAFNDKTRGYNSLEEATQDIAIRRKSEIERYLNLYQLDLTDPVNYKMLINTFLTNVNDTAEAIKSCEEYYHQGKPFTKTWASPETFWPTQDIRQTCSTYNGTSIDDLVQSIKQNGVFPDSAIYSTSVRDNNYSFVADGHHRVLACIMAGKTLIPYKATRETDQATVPSQSALSRIYDHEDCKKPDGTIFRYRKYPAIEREADEHDTI